MDSQDKRPKRPSLLVGDTPHADTPGKSTRILADMGGTAGKPAAPAARAKPQPVRRPNATKPRRWPWLALGALVIVVIGAGLRVSRDGAVSPASRTTQTAAELTAARQAGRIAQEDASTTGALPLEHPMANDSAAVIIDDATNSGIARANAPAAAGSSALAQTQASRDLGKIFAAPASKPVVHRRHRAHAHNADVDLLAALMTYLDTTSKHPNKSDSKGKLLLGNGSDAIAEIVRIRFRSCPKANTPAGISCRQRVCAKYVGQTPSCPAPSAAAAALTSSQD